MYRPSTSVLLPLLIWVASVKAQAIGTQSIGISEEEIFECAMYLGCEAPLETGKQTRLRDIYEMGGPKFKEMSTELFVELSKTPLPSNADEYWNKTTREICAQKPEAEMKNIFTEFVQELATWWSNWCESKDPSDKVECDACAEGSTHLLELLTEAKANRKCGKQVPTSLPKFG